MATELWRERNVTAMNILRGRSFLVKLDPTRCGLITSQPGRIVAWAASRCWPNDLNESHQGLFCSKSWRERTVVGRPVLATFLEIPRGRPFLVFAPTFCHSPREFSAGVHPREFTRGSFFAGVHPREFNRWNPTAGVHPREFTRWSRPFSYTWSR